MHRILVKYFNEEKGMAGKMKIQGDLERCHTLLITVGFLRSFVMMRIRLQSSSLDEGEEEKQI